MSGAPRGCSGQLGNQCFRCCLGGADLCIYGQKSQKDALGTHGNCLASSTRAGCPQLSPQPGPGLGCQGVFWSLPVGKPIPSGVWVSAPPSPHLLCLLQCFLSCAWAPHHVLTQLCRGVTGNSRACPGTPQLRLPLLRAFVWLLPHQPEVLMQLFQSLQTEPVPILS